MPDVTVVVNTFDGYAMVWSTFCYSWQKFWSDCPWPIRFVTNVLDPPCGHALKTGKDKNWTTMTRKALTQVKTPLMLLVHSDFWLADYVDAKSMEEFADIIMRGEADHIRPRPTWSGNVRPGKRFAGDDRLVHFAGGSQYRSSNFGLYRIAAYLKLMKAGETAWQFERHSNDRIPKKAAHRFLCTMHYRFPYVAPLLPGWKQYKQGIVWKGKWTLAAVEYARREGLDIDFSVHPDGTKGPPVKAR
jgi:hypothetical protein